MCFDLYPDRVFVHAFRRDVAGWEDLLDARDGGVTFLGPAISVAGLTLDDEREG